jgi:hypothetical protein
VSDSRPNDEQVEEAAEHAARAIEHRRQMQRTAVESEAADGSDASALQDASAEHRRAAESEEADADEAAHEADSE